MADPANEPAAAAPAEEGKQEEEAPAAGAAAAAVADDAAGAAGDANKKPPPKEPIKIIPAVKRPEPERDPNVPTARDVIMDQVDHEQIQGTALLLDLIRFHYYLWSVSDDDDEEDGDDGEKTKAVPDDPSEVEDLAKRLITLMTQGKQYLLLGLEDVPRPFLIGKGAFFKKDGDSSYKRVDDEKEILQYVSTTILAQFKEISKDHPADEGIIAAIKAIRNNTDRTKRTAEELRAGPRPVDVLLIPIDADKDETVAYEHQSGNKRLLHSASILVSNGDSKQSAYRFKAACDLLIRLVDVSEADGTIVQKTPRLVLQTVSNHNPKTHAWKEIDQDEMAEFATAFVFEVFREKRLVDPKPPQGGGAGARIAGLLELGATNETGTTGVQPGGEGIVNPTTHDVLFGRGGMTNGHPGNRRFRDIIALHRPDYVVAQKMEKPKVARRIVEIIRTGNPMGRFLKKDEDGLWRDVGDKVATEKTSQGLRERSNVEKRRRSVEKKAAEKEASESGAPPPKRQKKDSSTSPASYLNGPVPDFGTAIPLSISMKNPGDEVKAENDAGDALEALAVDKDGKILVTKFDILFGRGGLTNHHKGNKRFRDIVASHRQMYVDAKKIEKPSVARIIVRAIRNGDPPGRFLRKDENGDWVDVGDKKAAEKTSQALREREKVGREKDGKKKEESTSDSAAAEPSSPVKQGEAKPVKDEPTTAEV